MVNGPIPISLTAHMVVNENTIVRTKREELGPGLEAFRTVIIRHGPHPPSLHNSTRLAVHPRPVRRRPTINKAFHLSDIYSR